LIVRLHTDALSSASTVGSSPSTIDRRMGVGA